MCSRYDDPYEASRHHVEGVGFTAPSGGPDVPRTYYAKAVHGDGLERVVIAMENEGVVTWGDEGHRARFLTPEPAEAVHGDGLREAAQAVSDHAEVDDNFDGEYLDFLVPAEHIDALRAALDAYDAKVQETL